MAQTSVNIRMDEDLKRQFDAFCSDVGMTMTTAICVFAKTAVREHRIPFEIKSGLESAETLKAMENAEKDVDMSRAFGSVEELMEDLNA